MVVKDIINLMKAVQQTDFDTFELTDKDFSLKLDRKSSKGAVSAPGPKLFSEIPTGGALNLLSDLPEASANAAVSGKEVLSPLIGIYHSLPDGKAVKPGDKVKKGQPVCLIEAMKLMNEVQMPEDGEIIKVYAEDGATVEYEQALFEYA